MTTIEAETARIREALNRDDKQEAYDKLKIASELVEKAVALIYESAESVEHLPETDRIAALNIDLEDAETAIRKELRRLKA